MKGIYKSGCAYCMPKSLEHSPMGPLAHCMLLLFMNATLHIRVKLKNNT